VGSRWTRAELPFPRSLPETCTTSAAVNARLCSIRTRMASGHRSGRIPKVPMVLAEGKARPAAITTMNPIHVRLSGSFLGGSALSAIRTARPALSGRQGHGCCVYRPNWLGHHSERVASAGNTHCSVLLSSAVLGRVGAVRALEKDVAVRNRQSSARTPESLRRTCLGDIRQPSIISRTGQLNPTPSPTLWSKRVRPSQIRRGARPPHEARGQNRTGL